jgi:hypothetical protein
MRTNRDVQELKAAIRVCYAILGCFSVLRGIGYLPGAATGKLPTGVEVLTEYVPVGFWAIMWLGAAGMCFVGAIVPRIWLSYGMVGMSLTWSVGYAISWLLGVGTFATFLSVSTYVLLAGLIISGSFIATRGLRLARRPVKLEDS